MSTNNNNNNNRLSEYLNGSMSKDEAADFLRLAKNDPFLSDAIEGFQQTEAHPDDLLEIKGRIVKPAKRSYLKMVVGLSVAASLILIAFYFVKDMSSNLNPEGKGVMSSQVFDVPIIFLQDSNATIDTVFIIENDMRPYTAEIRIVPHNFDVPESIAPLHVNYQILVENNVPENGIENIYKYRSNHYYSYLGDFKVVDYRYDKRKNHDNLNIINNSTIFVANSSTLIPATQMTYVDFLEFALNKYRNGDYPDAMSDFNIILEQYPSDANANFYKALCYYELGENDKALNLFEATLNERVNTFHQESLWYSGLIYTEEQQYAAAEKVLKEIVNEEGYYGVQAKKELDELYKTYLNE